jgi:hypothetical protein
MVLATYSHRFATWISTINAILLFSCFICVYCSDQPIISYDDAKWITLFPVDVQDKVLEIYNRIPGTILKLLDPKPITKQAECSEQDLIIEKSIGTYNAECNNMRKTLDDSMNKKTDDQNVKKRDQKLRLESMKEEPIQKKTVYTGCGIGNEYDKGCNNLREHLQKSLKRMFHAKEIVEISSDDLAQEIAKTYFQQCPDWSEQNKYSSVILRFNSSYLTNNFSLQMITVVYVYAHLILKCTEPLFSWLLWADQCKISYDLTIELNGISIDSSKISEFSQLVAKNDVSDSIKKIEKEVLLTWEDLDDTSPRKASTPKSTTRLDDL